MKRIILSIMVLMAADVVTAQDEGQWSVKPMAGMTVATYTGDDATDSRSSIGWGGGVEAEYRVNKLLSLDFGLLYTRDRVKSVETLNFKDPTMEFTTDHIRLTTERMNLPVMLGLHVVPGLTLKAGLQASMLLSAKEKYHVKGFVREVDYDHMYTTDELATLPKTPFEKDVTTGVKKELKDLGLEIPLGASYEWNNVVLDVRYHFSLLHAACHTEAYRRYLMLTLGYRLPL